MGLSDDLSAVAASAAKFAAPGETLDAILVAEAAPGERIYLCAFAGPEGHTWLALDDDEAPVTSRNRIREAVTIAGLCEIAEEQAGGGELEELRRQLAGLRLTENPPAIDEAEQAALALERTLVSSPRVASPAYLDEVGAATRRLEQALGNSANSPFAVTMQQALAAVEELAKEVEAQYKLPLT
ncbi:MAG: hypothetical protein WAQ33_10720 [Gaiellaceae bacterium]